MFFTKEDLLASIKEKHVNELAESNDDLVDEAIADAISQVRDFLATNYNVDLIFSSTGTARHRQVLRWVRFISIYRLYDRMDDVEAPKKVERNYDDTVAFLEGVADGTHNVELPRKIVEQPGESNTKFRWGSILKRSH